MSHESFTIKSFKSIKSVNLVNLNGTLKATGQVKSFSIEDGTFFEVTLNITLISATFELIKNSLTRGWKLIVLQVDNIILIYCKISKLKFA